MLEGRCFDIVLFGFLLCWSYSLSKSENDIDDVMFYAEAFSKSHGFALNLSFRMKD